MHSLLSKASCNMEVKKIVVKPTTLTPPKATVLYMDKGTAVKLIGDLASDLANTGISKLVLRGEDNQFFILHVEMKP